MKVWYPGPAVEPAAAGESQRHGKLGLIVPGWNDVADGPDLADALAAGFVATKEPTPAVVAAVAGPAAEEEARESRGRRRRHEEKE